METKLNCEEVRAALPLFVGGDLESPDPAAVDRHLAACGACAAAMDRAHAARSAFARLESAPGAPPEIWSGVRARLLEEGLIRGAPAAPAPARREPAALRRWVPLAATLAAGLLIAAGLWLAGDPWGVATPPASGERRVAEEGAGDDPRPAPVTPDALSRPDGAHPVALQPLAPEDWPMAVPTEAQLRSAPTRGDGVMAGGGVPSRFH